MANKKIKTSKQFKRPLNRLHHNPNKAQITKILLKHNINKYARKKKTHMNLCFYYSLLAPFLAFSSPNDLYNPKLVILHHKQVAPNYPLDYYKQLQILSTKASLNTNLKTNANTIELYESLNIECPPSTYNQFPITIFYYYNLTTLSRLHAMLDLKPLS